MFQFYGECELEVELAKLSTTLPLVGSTVVGWGGVYDKVFRVYVLTGLSHIITCKVHFPSSVYHIVPPSSVYHIVPEHFLSALVSVPSVDAKIRFFNVSTSEHFLLGKVSNNELITTPLSLSPNLVKFNTQ